MVRSSAGTCINHWYLECSTRNVCDAKLPHLRTRSFRRHYSVSSVSMRRAVSGERIVLKLVLEIWKKQEWRLYWRVVDG